MKSMVLSRKSLVLVLLAFALVPMATLAQRAKYNPLEDEEGRYAKEGSYGIRLSGGLSIPMETINFKDIGNYQNTAAAVTHEEFDSKNHLAASLGFKYNVLSVMALGFSFDYYVFPIEDIGLRSTSAKGDLNVNNLDVGDVHVLSMYPLFVEFRLPDFQLQPYVQVGAGLNLNISDFNKNLMDIQELTYAVFASFGLEYLVSDNVGLFTEFRGYVNRSPFEFSPVAQSQFKGDINMSIVSVTVGLTLYFGGGSAEEEKSTISRPRRP